MNEAFLRKILDCEFLLVEKGKGTITSVLHEGAEKRSTVVPVAYTLCDSTVI